MPPTCHSKMLLKLTTLTLALFKGISANPFDQEWHDWKIKHKAIYGTQTIEAKRYEIFQESREFVKLHNERFENGAETYKVGLNKFAAMSGEEVAAVYKNRQAGLSEVAESLTQSGLDLPGSPNFEYNCPIKFNTNGSEPPTILSYKNGTSCTANNKQACTDIPIWTTSVKDQGSCGSCWTFGTAAALEGSLCKQGRFDCTTWSGVSTQQFLDCASRTSRSDDIWLFPFDNYGCGGGFQPNAFRYVTLNGNMVNSWDDYPYVSGETRRPQKSCNFDQSKAIKNSLIHCGTLQNKGDETELAQAVNEQGVLTIGVDASGRGFDLYTEGIYTNNKCGSRDRDLDHAVTLTGYGLYPFGSSNGKPYWEVKNSWGSDWGMEGYILFEKDNDNACGVATDVSWAVGN